MRPGGPSTDVLCFAWPRKEKPSLTKVLTKALGMKQGGG